MLSPSSQKGATIRRRSTVTLCRVLGGDTSLANQIFEIRRVKESLRESGQEARLRASQLYLLWLVGRELQLGRTQLVLIHVKQIGASSSSVQHSQIILYVFVAKTQNFRKNIQFGTMFHDFMSQVICESMQAGGLSAGRPLNLQQTRKPPPCSSQQAQCHGQGCGHPKKRLTHEG